MRKLIERSFIVDFKGPPREVDNETVDKEIKAGRLSSGATYRPHPYEIHCFYNLYPPYP